MPRIAEYVIVYLESQPPVLQLREASSFPHLRPALNFAGENPEGFLIVTLAMALICTAAACREVAPAFGTNIPFAKQNADEFFYSVGSRFTNIQRPQRILRARQQFGHYALTPSGVYNDTTIWLSIGPDSARLFGDEGHFSVDRYIVSTALSNDPPDALTESREIVRLRRLATMSTSGSPTSKSLGRIAAKNITDVLAAALAAGEGKSSAAIRANYTSAFPRTGAALGRLFTIDTLRTITDSEGATTFEIAIKLTPEILKATMPHYAYDKDANLPSLLLDADFSRIKQCRGNHCGWLFYDSTKNKSRQWCDMSVCGNRAKASALRARIRHENQVAK